MASWIDVFSLVMTALFFVGSIIGIFYATHAISSRFQSTKTLLENRGITISRDGVSLKTQQRFDREAYLDATQRGLVKAFGATTVGSGSNRHAVSTRSSSNSTSAGDEGVALRRSHSDGHGESH